MTSAPASFPRLLGDIGGSNARFAIQLVADGPLIGSASLPCKDYAGPEQAIRHYLSLHAAHQPVCAALGVADDASGDRVRLTNFTWEFSVSGLQDALGLSRLLVINDFTALALGVPDVASDDLHVVGAGKALSGAPMAVLGAGTGLGVSGLIRAGTGWLALQTQGGHVSLAADNVYEAAVIQSLREQFGHASAERALSGPGLVNLHQVVGRLAGVNLPVLTAAEIVARGRAGPEGHEGHDDSGGRDPHCARVLDLFFGFLGSVAGNLALTLGARGGVYVGGGIVPRLLPELDRSAFRERFEAKGRFRGYLSSIPVWVIKAGQSPALLGASRALDLPAL